MSIIFLKDVRKAYAVCIWNLLSSMATLVCNHYVKLIGIIHTIIQVLFLFRSPEFGWSSLSYYCAYVHVLLWIGSNSLISLSFSAYENKRWSPLIKKLVEQKRDVIKISIILSTSDWWQSNIFMIRSDQTHNAGRSFNVCNICMYKLLSECV